MVLAVMSKVWEVAVLAIVVCLAAKLVLGTVLALLPSLIPLLVMCLLAGAFYDKKRRW